MSFIKSNISLFTFFLFLPLQNMCMNLPKEMIQTIGIHSDEKTHLNLARTCKENYTALGYNIPVENYIKKLVEYAQENNVTDFYCLLGRAKPPYIKEEIDNVINFFKKFPETKELSIINLYDKHQKDNNPFPLKKYNISDKNYTIANIINGKNRTKTDKYIPRNLSVANLIYHQGYPAANFSKKQFPSHWNRTLMHRAAETHNPETLRISFNIPGLTLNDEDIDECTPIALAMSVIDKATQKKDNYIKSLSEN